MGTRATVKFYTSKESEKPLLSVDGFVGTPQELLDYKWEEED